MRGELGIKIQRIVIDKPSLNANGLPINDIKLEGENGEFLYIIGDNDIPGLLREALKEYYMNKKEWKK
jgi:hypothetical protein